MKTILRFIAVVLFVSVIFLVLINISNSIALESNFFSVRANIGFLIFLCSVISSIGTILFLISIGVSLGNQSKLKKQIESTKLNYEVESDKVKQLEGKIKTLEEALKKAISQ